MLISKELVSAVITNFVPQEYWGGRGIVSFYQLIPQIHLNQFARKHLPWPGSYKALVLDWDLLRKGALPKGPELPPENFGIYLSHEIKGVWQLAFILLHEIGHMEQKLSEDPKVKNFRAGKEAYADFYAVTRLGEVLGFKKAMEILQKNSSEDGWERIMDLYGKGEL